MHRWGDGFPYFDDVDNAAYDIRRFCIRWGRLGGQAKEKYGTVRFYTNFGVRGLHSLTHPGYCHYAWYPRWLIYLDIYHLPKFFYWTGIQWFFSKWQPFIYNLAYKRALKKYPHIEAEILSDADYPELIKGHTRSEGNKLHILNTRGETVATWTTHGEDG
jgi:hypothetical protein